MRAIKYILMGIGVIAIILSIYILIVGVKVVSTVFVYIVGFLAILALIGFAIYYGNKLFSRKEQ